MKLQEKMLGFLLTARKGSTDMTDKIINLAVAALVLFSLFGTIYASYISANGTAGMTSTHILMLGIVMTMLIIGFLLMIWRSAKGGK